MKAMTFTLLSEPMERLDLSVLTPSTISGLTLPQIEKLRVGTSRRPAVVGDLFKVEGTDRQNLVLQGGSARFDRVGAGMDSGSLRVIGNVGSQAGRKMSGGRLTIEGNAGDHAGSGMAGGRFELMGSAGDHVGAPLAGEISGMQGGVFVIRGRAGHYAGDRLRRGIVAIGKGCGDYTGCRMIAGTIVVVGRVGAMPGYLMKRGSLVFDRHPAALSPTFVACGRPDMAFSSLFDRYLIAEGIFERPLLGQRPGKYAGDTAVSGKGELLYRSAR